MQFFFYLKIGWINLIEFQGRKYLNEIKIC